MAMKRSPKQRTGLLKRPAKEPNMQHPSDHHYGRANEGRDRVELCAQHGWDFPHEDVPHDAAADSRQHPN
jgi:hypothetical protein